MYWYGLLYFAAFVVGAFLIGRLQKFRRLNLTIDQRWWLVITLMIGVVVGGRLGYAFFYEPTYFWLNPWFIPAIWQGGMSSHGGFVGVAIGILIFSYLCKLDAWAVADVIIVPAALGLALGRLGNFINQELYGTITTLPWGISVPGEEGMRHPIQLYAVGVNILIALGCFAVLRRISKPGSVTAVFLIAYSLARFLLEYWRVQDYGWVAIGPLLFSWGQIYTVPLLISGLWLGWHVYRKIGRVNQYG